MEIVIRTKHDRDSAVQAVLAIRSDPVKIVSIKDYVETRRDKQNRYYWGIVLKTISDHTGDDAESIHEYLKIKFLDGEKAYAFGHEVMVYPSTTKLSVKAFNQYLDAVTHFALHELGIYMPVME